MGIKVYYYMVAAVLGGGILLPQHGKRKKVYIALMAVLHTNRSGWKAIMFSVFQFTNYILKLIIRYVF